METNAKTEKHPAPWRCKECDDVTFGRCNIVDALDIPIEYCVPVDTAERICDAINRVHADTTADQPADIKVSGRPWYTTLFDTDRSNVYDKGGDCVAPAVATKHALAICSAVNGYPALQLALGKRRAECQMQKMRAEKAEAVIAKHNLCHDQHGRVGRDEFEAGCRSETIKEFGSCGWDAKLMEYRELLSRAEYLIKQTTYRATATHKRICEALGMDVPQPPAGYTPAAEPEPDSDDAVEQLRTIVLGLRRRVDALEDQTRPLR